MARSAPRRASSAAAAAPIPLVPPVINATLPRNSMITFLCQLGLSLAAVWRHASRRAGSSRSRCHHVQEDHLVAADIDRVWVMGFLRDVATIIPVPAGPTTG